MTVHSRGRHVTFDLFKAGERCQLAADYICENCKAAGRQESVKVENGAIFPLCPTCSDLDMGWRPRPGSWK